MSGIGFKYGSEWHLMHYLGRHRNALDRAVLGVTEAWNVEWLDFPLSGDGSVRDAEWEGIDFLFSQDTSGLLNYSYLKDNWAKFWPQSGRQQNWDAIGILRKDTQCEWLLVEAKAHTAEMTTENGCDACDKSKLQIREALGNVGAALGVNITAAWTGLHYQYANRLATLWFLLTHGVAAHLLYIYFLGDDHAGRVCPTTPGGWQPSIDEQDRALGLDQATNRAMIEQRVHKIFPPVLGT
jgi:hypothetical protein